MLRLFVFLAEAQPQRIRGRTLPPSTLLFGAGDDFSVLPLLSSILFSSIDFDNKIFTAVARYFCREHCSMLTLYFRTCCLMLGAACVSWFVVLFFIKLDNQSFAVDERYC